MPSYYQPGKFRKKMERLEEQERKAFLAELGKTKNKPKPLIDELCASIGRDLAKFRREAGMTQLKLAEIIKTSQSAIGRIESGRHNLTVKNLKRIAKVFKKDLKINIE